MVRAVVVGLAAAAVSGVFVHAQRVRSEPARVAAMHDNLRMVTAIQAAVIAGDLSRVVPPARQVAQLTVPPGLPDAATRHVEALTVAAREAASAPSVASAATATAHMLVRCGSCHREVGTMPAIAAPAMPSVRGTVGHMLDHQRAVDQLLHGLVIPSSTEWMAGARALRASPLHAERSRSAKLPAELLRVEEAVHRLAEDAVAAESPDARVRVYGTLLARCADCHSLHARVWGPPPHR
jgi:cytochrome c553